MKGKIDNVMNPIKVGVAICLLLICNGCYRPFDWEDPDYQSHIVLFSSICPDSTVGVYVSQSYGINMPQIDTLAEARVSLYINGQEADRSSARPKAGDTVRLVAEAEGLPTAEGSTIVPAPVAIQKAEVELQQDVIQYRVTLDDPAGEENYYGLQISEISKDFPDQGSGVRLNTHAEPLFSHLSAGLIDDLLEQDNHIQTIIYPFSDQTIQGQRYTLQVSSPYRNNSSADSLRFRIRLYTLTRDYYQYVLSVGLTNMEKLPDAGLSDPIPLHHNVVNGLGLVGGYALSEQGVTLPGRE